MRLSIPEESVTVHTNITKSQVFIETNAIVRTVLCYEEVKMYKDGELNIM